MGIYYDGTKLRNMKDLNGETPEIFITCGNKTAGKSYDWKCELMRDFIENGNRFMLIYRWVYELSGCEQAFYEDIKETEFPGHEITSQSEGRGLYRVIYLDGEEMGFAVYLNAVDTLKRFSSRFVNVQTMFFDEFQSESEHYCDKEIQKFQALHTLVARGHGKQTRYVRTVLVSNNVSTLNPYFLAFGIHKRLDSKTKFMRGEGWVLEITMNEHAKKAAQDSAFNRAFGESEHFKYAYENAYLLDKDAFVEKMNHAQMYYQATVVYDGKYYGIHLDKKLGHLYCSRHGDPNHPFTFALSADDHSTNTIMIKNNQYVLQQWRMYYNMGCWRFENLECKNVLFDLLSRR